MMAELLGNWGGKLWEMTKVVEKAASKALMRVVSMEMTRGKQQAGHLEQS